LGCAQLVVPKLAASEQCIMSEWWNDREGVVRIVHRAAVQPLRGGRQ
jgi:hypothetical protein